MTDGPSVLVSNFLTKLNLQFVGFGKSRRPGRNYRKPFVVAYCIDFRIPYSTVNRKAGSKLWPSCISAATPILGRAASTNQFGVGIPQPNTMSTSLMIPALRLLQAIP